MTDAFGVVDDVLLQAVQGIIDLVTAPGLINLDFADVRSVMQDAGPALIGLGRGTGEHRATDAARQAIASPLLEASIDGAHGILFNVSGPADLKLREVRQAAEVIREHADPEANVIFGASFSDTLGEDVLITLIATGLARHGRTAIPLVGAGSTDGAQAAEPVIERPAEQAAPAAPAAPAASHIRARSSVGPELPDHAPHRRGSREGNDLDVPSFLRRRGRPTSQS